MQQILLSLFHVWSSLLVNSKIMYALRTVEVGTPRLILGGSWKRITKGKSLNYLQNINVSWWTFLKPRLRSVFISLKFSFQSNLYSYDLYSLFKMKIDFLILDLSFLFHSKCSVYKMCMFPLFFFCQLSEKFTNLQNCHFFI